MPFPLIQSLFIAHGLIAAANRREDRAKAASLERVDEELKILADLKRYVFTAFLAVTVGTFNAKEELSQYVGAGAALLLFLSFCVLVIVRYRKLKKYEHE